MGEVSAVIDCGDGRGDGHEDGRVDSARRQILRAAAHQFARRSYSAVNLDDILTEAQLTKGAMYFHFRSKRALAVAVIDEAIASARKRTADTAGQSALETLIDVTFTLACQDLTEDLTRAGLNLLAAIGKEDGLSHELITSWTDSFARLAKRAVDDGDVAAGADAREIARTVVSLFLGLRQTSRDDDPADYLASLRGGWALLLPGVVVADREEYFARFVARRTKMALRNTDRDDVSQL
ncbi:TetR/AcrR family transcriptional regulator [Mycolicibacterium palauense]|uniref:TetR/AcrR family transcriptional regulator n=1 Tax=Mycolicibacterium palauense TaxID=2034511 RepID=UPI000BFEB420|nr:TetR/AcrR family transcriptional regulator [Mycolicibacterium palauense]